MSITPNAYIGGCWLRICSIPSDASTGCPLARVLEVILTTDELTVPSSLLTMVLATVEQLLGSPDVGVRVLTNASAGPRLQLACARSSTPEDIVVATLVSTDRGIEIAYTRPRPAQRPSIDVHAPAANKQTTSQFVRAREIRQVARRRAADAALAAYDFSPQRLTGTSGWQFTTSDNTWTRTVVLLGGPWGETSSVVSTFAVSFVSRTAVVEQVMVLARHPRLGDAGYAAIL